MRRRNSFGIPKLFRREPSTEGRTAATRRPARGRDGPVELVSEAEVDYPLAPLDEIRIKRPSLEPLACRLKAIAVNLHGVAPFVLGGWMRTVSAAKLPRWVK